LRGLVLTPFQGCINRFEELSGSFYRLVCSACGKEKNYREYDMLDLRSENYVCKRCSSEMDRSEYSRKSRVKLRIEALKKLQDSPRCLVCGEADISVLCVDHVFNDGYIERRKLGTLQIWRKILQMPLEYARIEYQILCRNCNWKKHLSV